MSRARDLSKIGNINTFAVDSTDTQVGIASTVPNATLDVGGDGVFTGIVTASSFSGSLNDTNIVGTACTFTTGTFNGNVTIGGTLTYEDVTNVDALGIVTARAGVNVSGGQIQVGVAYSVGVAGVATAAGFVGPLTGDVTGDVTGAVSGTTGSFSSNLTVGSGITFGSAGVATFSGTSDVHLHDGVKAKFGTASDFEIYHDGTNNYLVSGNGLIRIRHVSDDAIITYADGAVELYHDSNLKLATTNNGSYTTGIHTATGSLVAGVNADTGVDLRFRANRGSANQTIGNINGYWNDTVVGQIRFMAGEDTTNKDDGHLVFYTAPSGSVAERLRIASNGRIGIATEVPEALVDIEGGEVYYHSGTGNDLGVKLSYSNGNSTGIIDTYGNHDLELRTNNVARFVLDTSGNLQTKTTTQNGYVGLTTTSNAINLTFGGTSGTSPRMYLKGVGNGQSDAGDVFIAAGTGGLMQLRSAEDIRFEVNSDSTTAEALRVTSAGYVGINTTTPTTYLDVFGGSNSIEVGNQSGSGRFGADGTSTKIGSHTNHHLDLFTNSSSNRRLRITSGGGFLFDNGELVERCNITAGKLSDNTNIDLEDGMVHYFTTQESTTSTPNIRVSSSTTLNSVMDAGDVVTVTLVTTAAAGGYSANVTIDGNAVTEEWVGGSAPSAGGDDGLDIYVYTIICTHASNTGDSGFKVIANCVNATN